MSLLNLLRSIKDVLEQEWATINTTATYPRHAINYFVLQPAEVLLAHNLS